MTAADKLAQVLAQHWSVSTHGSVDKCDGCGAVVHEWGQEVPYGAPHPLAHHQAAVVLAHLTAEGWAQGREEWGVQVHIASVAGRGTRVEPVDTEEQARDPYRHVFVAHGETIERKVPVRRRVTDWEPADA